MANEKLRRIREALGAEEHKAVRAGRAKVLFEAAQKMAQVLAELGPCYAVTIAYSIVGEGDDEIETNEFTGWFEEGPGRAHLAAVARSLTKQVDEYEAALREAEREQAPGERPGGGDLSDDGEPGGAPS